MQSARNQSNARENGGRVKMSGVYAEAGWGYLFLFFLTVQRIDLVPGSSKVVNLSQPGLESQRSKRLLSEAPGPDMTLFVGKTGRADP